MRVLEVPRKNPRLRNTPRLVHRSGYALIFAQVDAVEQPRIEPFPPLALTVREREVAVVGNAGFGSFQVGGERALPPVPSVFMVKSNAVAHSHGLRCLGPL